MWCSIAALELALPLHEYFRPPGGRTVVAFTHGGLVFWAVSSALFALLYSAVTAAPLAARLLPRPPPLPSPPPLLLSPPLPFPSSSPPLPLLFPSP